MTEPMLVTGAARSGTSMVAGIVHLCGAFGGKMSGPTRHNREGMFENYEVRNSVAKPLLTRMKVDRMGQRPLPDIEECHAIAKEAGAETRKRVVSIMEQQGYSGGPWFYKGAKMCLMSPIWNAAFPKAKWLIVRRNDEDIVRSCMRTSFMRGYRNPEGWQRWVNEHKLRCVEMTEARLAVSEVWSDDIVGGDLARMRSAISWLGLSWTEVAVQSFVDPSLFTQGKSAAC